MQTHHPSDECLYLEIHSNRSECIVSSIHSFVHLRNSEHPLVGTGGTRVNKMKSHSSWSPLLLSSEYWSPAAYGLDPCHLTRFSTKLPSAAFKTRIVPHLVLTRAPRRPPCFSTTPPQQVSASLQVCALTVPSAWTALP